jgi:prepilin-type processing-associated H-X9-DG protein
MREELIRYLLGELGADERRDLQSRLKSSPELRAELEQLRSCFAANQDDDLFAPDAPRGLAARTAGLVASGEGSGNSLGARQATEVSHVGDPPTGFLGWSLADLTVAGGVMLAVSMLIFPAIRNSRDGSRRTQCGDHLRQIAVYAAVFAENNGGFYPQVGPDENAGVFTARLIGKGHVQPDELAILLVCPGAPKTDKVRVIPLPNAEEIRKMSAGQLMRITADASPFYNYRFPYRVGNKYYNIRDEHRSLSPVFADAPGGEDGEPMSPNHCGRVVQVAFADGSVRTLTSVNLPGLNDDMYHNDLGKVAAGLGPMDTVLGRSNVTPGGFLSGSEGK